MGDMELASIDDHWSPFTPMWLMAWGAVGVMTGLKKKKKMTGLKKKKKSKSKTGLMSVCNVKLNLISLFRYMHVFKLRPFKAMIFTEKRHHLTTCWHEYECVCVNVCWNWWIKGDFKALWGRVMVLYKCSPFSIHHWRSNSGFLIHPA